MTSRQCACIGLTVLALIVVGSACQNDTAFRTPPGDGAVPRPDDPVVSGPGPGTAPGRPTGKPFGDQDLEPLLEKTEAAAILELATGKIIATARRDRLEVPRLPGSVFKLIAAASSLEQGLDDPEFTCTGTLEIGGKTLRCWDPRGHGEVRLIKALALSCNLYFEYLAARLDPVVFLAQTRRFGLGRPSGFAPGEAVPALPEALTRDELLAAVLGDCKRLPATGFQLLEMAAILSGVGPLASAGRSSDEVLREGMRQAAAFGTAAVNGAPVPFAAKTGSARQAAGWRIHGWCIGFVPVGDPVYAFVVYHPNGMGSDAAGSVGRIVRALFPDVRAREAEGRR